MSVKPIQQHKLIKYIIPATAMMFIVYFSFHAIQGQYGIRQHSITKNEIQKLLAIQKIQNKQQKKLETKIKLLTQKFKDGSLIDEEIRKQLNYTKKNEIVIFKN